MSIKSKEDEINDFNNSPSGKWWNSLSTYEKHNEVYYYCNLNKSTLDFCLKDIDIIYNTTIKKKLKNY